MIAAVIRWSARNLMLVLIATAALVGGGLFAVGRLSLDALPDLSDVQVIIYTEYPGQAPAGRRGPGHLPAHHRDAGRAEVRVVRGFSFFGVSFVYVIFEDGTDIYWARSRVLEYLNFARSACRPGRAPDARSRRHRRGLGLPVRAARREPHAGRAAHAPGLVPALPADEGAGRRRGRCRRRLRAASTRSWSIPLKLRSYGIPLCARGRRSSATPTATSAGAWSRWPRPSTWCAATATCAAWRPRDSSSSGADGRHAGPAPRRGAHRARPRRTARPDAS